MLAVLFAVAGCQNGGKGGGAPEPTATITVTPGAPGSITAGEYQQFTATITYLDGTTQDITNIATWASSDINVAVFNPTDGPAGNAFAQLGGTATITATMAGITSSPAVITVHEKVLAAPAPAEPCPTPTVANPVFSGRDVRLMYPFRISRTQSGWFLASDLKRNLIVSIDPATGQASRSLHIDGAPTGVVMHGKEIFVANKTRQSIEIFCFDGKPLGHLAAEGTLGDPMDLAVDETAGLVFALDISTPAIRVYDIATRTQLGTTIGAPPQIGALIAPIGIAVDPVLQTLYVTERGIRYGNGSVPDAGSVPASIQIFSYAAANFGTRLGEISGGFCGSFGCSDTGFSNPRGLTVHNGFIYMTEVLRGQVMVFDLSSLTLVAALGLTGETDRELRMPSDVAIHSNGDVYVTNTLKRTLFVFPGGAQ